MKGRRALFAALPVALVLVLGGSAGAADEPDELIAGKVAIVKPGKIAKFVAKPPKGSAFNLPSANNDPTIEGGALHFFDLMPGGAGNFTFNLPAGNWVGLGNPAGIKGFKYKGGGVASDPCKVVIVKPTVVKAVCKGADVGFVLPFGGNAGIVLDIGTDTKRYCLEFGGTPKGDPNKLLKRKDAPAPPVCPQIGTPPPTATRTNTALPTNTSPPGANTPTRTPTLPPPTSTRTNTPGGPVNTPTRTPTSGGGVSCGNGLIETGEACMSCPANQTCQGCLPGQPCQACPQDCTVSPCTASATSITFRVDLTVPPGQDVGTIAVLMGYRSNLVSLPSPFSTRFTNLQPGGSRTLTDFDYAVQYIYTLATGLSSGGLFTVRFDRCQGANAPTVADFSCTVQACTGGAGQVEGCGCFVTTP